MVGVAGRWKSTQEQEEKEGEEEEEEDRAFCSTGWSTSFTMGLALRVLQMQARSDTALNEQLHTLSLFENVGGKFTFFTSWILITNLWGEKNHSGPQAFFSPQYIVGNLCEDTVLILITDNHWQECYENIVTMCDTIEIMGDILLTVFCHELASCSNETHANI